MTTGAYTSEQIVQVTGVGIRTFRHWIGLGILPGPRGRGPAARYDEHQIQRVRVVQALRAQGARLPEIKRRLVTMTPEEMQALVPIPSAEPGFAPRSEGQSPDGRATDTSSPQTPVGYRSTPWETVELIPGLLLMVAPNRGELPRRLAIEIWQHYASSAR